MNILFAASEVAPFIKTGGLADVAGSLPQKLADMGHDVKVILPLYEGVGQQYREKMRFLFHWSCRLAWRTPYCGLFELREGNISYLFVDNEYYFKRAEIYGHYDDGERFAFFSRAVIETPAHLDWHPDVIHCNDWETALVPIYLLEERERIWQLRGTKSVYTIHNIEYQGRYGDQIIQDLLGLHPGYMNEHMLAFHGDVNLMKGAIYAADYVTTVSPTYADELQYPFYAHGLEGVVADNRWKMRGILNGLDVGLYDPASGSGLAAPFTAGDLTGKAACKQALQQAVGLREDPEVPIIACVSRLVKHKGFELVAQSIHEIMGMNVQMVVLGTGEWQFEEAFRQAQAQYPGRFSARRTALLLLLSTQLSCMTASDGIEGLLKGLRDVVKRVTVLKRLRSSSPGHLTAEPLLHSSAFHARGFPPLDLHPFHTATPSGPGSCFGRRVGIPQGGE